MTIMSSQNQRININTAKTSARKLRNVKPSARKSIAILLVHWTDLLRASRAACAFFVACDTLPIFAGGTRVRRRRLGSARMPSLGVSPVGGRDRKSTRLNSSHLVISYAVFCLKKKKKKSYFHSFIIKKNKIK